MTNADCILALWSAAVLAVAGLVLPGCSKGQELLTPTAPAAPRGCRWNGVRFALWDELAVEWLTAIVPPGHPCRIRITTAGTSDTSCWKADSLSLWKLVLVVAPLVVGLALCLWILRKR